MDLPFSIAGVHIFRGSDLTATEKERWIAYIAFISEIILTITKGWIVSINHYGLIFCFLASNRNFLSKIDTATYSSSVQLTLAQPFEVH
jgi:hypothetical protein